MPKNHLDSGQLGKFHGLKDAQRGLREPFSRPPGTGTHRGRCRQHLRREPVSAWLEEQVDESILVSRADSPDHLGFVVPLDRRIGTPGGHIRFQQLSDTGISVPGLDPLSKPCAVALGEGWSLKPGGQDAPELLRPHRTKMLRHGTRPIAANGPHQNIAQRVTRDKHVGDSTPVFRLRPAHPPTSRTGRASRAPAIY